MTTDPSLISDSEGEELSLNKVDTALQSIGISIQDAQGQFRDFDDVILELSSRWDTLSTNSQRYIATIMAEFCRSCKTLLIAGKFIGVYYLV